MANTCPKCGGSMEAGTVLDDSYYEKTAAKWTDATPRRRWWGMSWDEGVEHNVTTWRCARCGFLESYANA